MSEATLMPTPLDPKRAPRIAVFGGSGFVGRHIVRRLARAGFQVRVCVRHPNQALFLKTAGRPGQVTLQRTNICDAASVTAALDGMDGAINAVGILFETGSQKFSKVQAEGAANIAEAAKAAGIENLVHISAIGADAQAKSVYARTKAEGEAALRAALPSLHILRPSLVIGPEDDFFNRFANLAIFAPALPLIDGGTTRYQPISVFNLADAAVAALTQPPAAGVYEVGGPDILTFKEMMVMLLSEIDRFRMLVPLPLFAARFIATFAQFMPKPLLTPDQLILLQDDNIVTDDKGGLANFGITPEPIAGLLPSYLARFQPKG